MKRLRGWAKHSPIAFHCFDVIGF